MSAIIAERGQGWITLHVVCENGHRRKVTVEDLEDGESIWYIEGHDDRRHRHQIVSDESYAYTHGGCCYRAGNDAAAEVSPC